MSPNGSMCFFTLCLCMQACPAQCSLYHISESNQMDQPEFLYEVFEDFMDSPESIDFSFDNGLVCRWMTGQAKISPKICTYYARPSKQEKAGITLQAG